MFGAGAAFMNLASGSVWKLSAMNTHSFEWSLPLTRRWRRAEFEPLVPGTWTTRSRPFLSRRSHSHSCLRDQLVHREGPTVRIRFPPPGEYACAVNPGVIFVPLALCEQSIAIAAAEVVDAILDDFFRIGLGVRWRQRAAPRAKNQREANAP